jgi:hypothetical protein
VVGAPGPVVADPVAADAVGELAPPADDADDDAGDADDAVGELAAPPPPAPELAVPHAVSATAASRAPDASPARDARNDVFMRSPSAAEPSYGYGDARAPRLVRGFCR